MKGALQPTWPSLREQALDCLHVTTFATHGKGETGGHRFAINQDGARAALAAVASCLDAGEAGDLAQVIDQQLRLSDGILAPAAIEDKLKQSFSRRLDRCMH